MKPFVYILSFAGSESLCITEQACIQEG